MAAVIVGDARGERLRIMMLRNGFILGDWTIYPLEGRLQRGDDSQRVQPKSMDVLVCLAEADAAVVERDELLRRIWGERAVSDEPLTRCIGELRRALGDDRSDPGYILTVPKRGYRLLLSARPLADDRSTATESLSPPLTAAQESVPKRRFNRISALVAAVILAVIASELVGYLRGERAGSDRMPAEMTVAEHGSIAVLPFVDMTAKQDQAYFGDGLAEELINLLAQNPSLRVAARSSSFSFRDDAVPAIDVAQRLNVAHVVEGSVRRDGDIVRITAQLIEADDGFHVWSQTYEQPFGDVFSIQDEISKHIAAALEVSVLDTPAASRRTDPRAYTLYLQAKHSARIGSRESMEQAVAYLEETLSIDPGYAPGWAELANVYSNLAGQGHWDWDQGFTASREAAKRAVETDPGYFGGYQQLAWIAHRYEGDLPAAMQNMQTALDLEATGFRLLQHAAVLLLQFGRVDKAIGVLEYCALRAPTDPRGFYNLGVAYKYDDRLDEAERSFLKVLELSANYNGAKAQLGEVTLLLERPKDSLGYFEQLDGFRRLKGAALAQYAMGNRDDSDSALATLITDWGEEQPMTVVEVHAYRREPDAAFQWLEKDYQKYGAAGWGEVKLQRLFDNLRDDPRWLEFLERTGVTDEDLSAYDLRIDVLSD